LRYIEFKSKKIEENLFTKAKRLAGRSTDFIAGALGSDVAVDKFRMKNFANKVFYIPLEKYMALKKKTYANLDWGTFITAIKTGVNNIFSGKTKLNENNYNINEFDKDLKAAIKKIFDKDKIDPTVLVGEGSTPQKIERDAKDKISKLFADLSQTFLEREDGYDKNSDTSNFEKTGDDVIGSVIQRMSGIIVKQQQDRKTIIQDTKQFFKEFYKINPVEPKDVTWKMYYTFITAKSSKVKKNIDIEGIATTTLDGKDLNWEDSIYNIIKDKTSFQANVIFTLKQFNVADKLPMTWPTTSSALQSNKTISGLSDQPNDSSQTASRIHEGLAIDNINYNKIGEIILTYLFVYDSIIFEKSVENAETGAEPEDNKEGTPTSTPSSVDNGSKKLTAINSLLAKLGA
jgi:hypothetical protein